MLFAVPDALTNGGGAEGNDLPRDLLPGRPANGHLDLLRQPVLPTTAWAGRRPASISRARSTCSATSTRTARGRRSRTATTSGGTSSSANTGNCWFDNTGPDGTAASVTGPGDAGRRPGTRPGAALGLRHQRRRRRPRQARLPDRLLERARQRHRAHRLRLVAAGAAADERRPPSARVPSASEPSAASRRPSRRHDLLDRMKGFARP